MIFPLLFLSQVPSHLSLYHWNLLWKKELLIIVIVVLFGVVVV